MPMSFVTAYGHCGNKPDLESGLAPCCRSEIKSKLRLLFLLGFRRFFRRRLFGISYASVGVYGRWRCFLRLCMAC